ncbi:Golgi Transport [Dispira simplex]|nr:Golgi Transport [Dispira simplex]
MWLSDSQRVLLFFDAGLIAIGNIMFLVGVTLIIGVQKAFYFFVRPGKIKGSICFFAGILLVFIKWPIIGLLVEVFGFINLFGDFFPVVINFLRRVPFIGTFFNLPGISHVVDRIAGAPLPV